MYLNGPRPRRPYEKETLSRRGAVLFGFGAGALVAIVIILPLMLWPYISTRMENLSYHARTTYRKLVPHPEYLPTSVPTSVGSAAATANIDPTPAPSPTAAPPERRSDDVGPVSTKVAENTLPMPTPDLPPLMAEVQLDGLAHQWQTWNNCGPATITTNLSYFGHTERQTEAARLLKPNQDDKNVSPHELAAYARTTGLEAMVRQGGTIDQLKAFLSHDLPVLAETWLVHEGDGLGHYRLLVGYDDATGKFNTFDSLNGPNYKVDYAQFEADWRVFNRLYLVAFPPEQADTVAAIVGDDMSDTAMYERLSAQARLEAQANPDDAIAYFNQGEALTRLGRYQEAVIAFDRARELGLHWRRLWYQFTPFEAYYAVGRYQDVLDLTEATLKGTGGLEEAFYYRGLALQATGQPGAREDFEAALAYNSLFTPAEEALEKLNQ